MFTLMLYLEFTLTNLLLRSKFCITKQQNYDMINHNLVFVNGAKQLNLWKILKKHSTVQIILVKKYVIYYMYTYNLIIKWSFRTGYCLWRYYRHKFNIYKQKPQQLPKWLYKLMFYKYDVPKYLEIDYTILTFIILKVPTKIEDFNKFNRKILNNQFNRLLNWTAIN